MKNYILITSFLFAVIATSNAQIQIDKSDVGTPGTAVLQGVDTLPLFTTPDLGTTGGPQTWTFTGLKGDFYDSIIFADPSNLPNKAQFPTANLAMVQYGTTYYMEIDNNQMLGLGLAGDFLGTGSPLGLALSDEQVIYKFPLKYGDANTDTFHVNKVIVFPTPLPAPWGGTIDSVKIDRYGFFITEVDAHGDIKTPLGDYQCIRRKETEISRDKIFIPNPLFPFGDPWVANPLDPNPPLDTSVTMTWIAKGLGYPIFEAHLDSAGNTRYYNFIPPIAYIGIDENLIEYKTKVFPNPASEYIIIETELSESKQVNIYTYTGELVSQHAYSGKKVRVNLSEYADGVYFYHLKDSSGKILSAGKFNVTR